MNPKFKHYKSPFTNVMEWQAVMKRLKLETESICLLAKFLLICTFISLTFIKCIGLIELLVLDYCGYYVLWIGLNLLVCLITLLAWLSDCVDFDWLDCVKWVVLVDCVHSFDCVDWIDWSDRHDHIDLLDSIDCLDVLLLWNFSIADTIGSQKKYPL